MFRERALKVVLVVVGLLFCAVAYPVVAMKLGEESLRMMLSLYATMGVFLLLASRNPSEHRSLIAFAAWSSILHASVMAVQEYLGLIARAELIGVAVFFAIGVVLIALAPAKVGREVAAVSAA